MPHPVESTFTLGGHRIAYTSYGEGPRVIVLVHGLLLSQRMHAELAQALAERGNRAITIDLLGHGRSDRPPDMWRYSMTTFGAEVIVTPTAVPADHPDNYVMMAKRIARETPNAVLANQFYNQANPDAHYATTGPEIWEQTEGRVTAFCQRMGTASSLVGVSEALRPHGVFVQAHEPAGSPAISWWRAWPRRTSGC